MYNLKEALMSCNAKCVFLYHSARQSTSSQLDSEEEFSNVIIEQTNGCDMAEQVAQSENTEGETGRIPPSIQVPVQNNERMKRTSQRKKVMMTAAEKQQMKQYTNNIRVCRNIDPTQETMIACVWVLPFDMKRFTLISFCYSH
jgi:hypothetical protein